MKYYDDSWEVFSCIKSKKQMQSKKEKSGFSLLTVNRSNSSFINFGYVDPVHGINGTI